MSYLSDKDIKNLFDHRPLQRAESDGAYGDELTAVAWAYFVAREALDQAQRGAADAVSAKEEWESTTEESLSEELKDKVLSASLRADRAFFAATVALRDGAAVLKENSPLHGNLADFVFATAKYTYETVDAAKVANEAWKAVWYPYDGNDEGND